MKRILLILALPLGLLAQPAALIKTSNGAPTVGCAANWLDVNIVNGNLYTCVASVWTLSGGGAGAVSSVFSRTGAVVAATNDYNFNQLAGSASAAQITTALTTPPAIGGTTPAAGTFTQLNANLISTGVGNLNSRVPTNLDDAVHGASLTIAPYWINQLTGDTFQLISTATASADYLRVLPIYGLPLDVASSNVSAAFSLFKIKNTYSGNCIQVQRTSDNANQDLGFVNGFVDMATAGQFCEGTSCLVKTWYDQSGNGRNATQSTQAQMPFFAINTLGNRPTLSFSTQAVNNVVSLTNKYMSLAAGVSITNPNFGAVVVGQPRQISSGQYMVNLGTAFGTENSLGFSNTCAGSLNYMGFLDTAGNHCTTALVEEGPVVLGWFENSTNLQTWVNEQNVNGTKTSDTGTYTGGYIGWENSFSVPYYGDMSTVIIYTAAVTGTTRTRLFNSLYRLHGISPQYAMNTLMVSGDSLAGGFGAVADNGWPELSGKQMSVRILNEGIGGLTCTTLDSNYATKDAPLFPAFGRNKVLAVHCGVNDLVAGTSAATIWSHIQSYIGKAIATGWTVVATTVLPCNGQGSCTNSTYAALNALISAGYASAGATALIDFASDPNIGQASQNSNTTYYLTDALHPNDAGNSVQAQYAIAVLLPLLNR